MKVLQKITVVGFAAAAIVSMSACASHLEEDGGNSSVKTFAVTFPDNSKADCFVTINEVGSVVANSGLECSFGNKSTATATDEKLLGSFEGEGNNKVRCVTINYVTAKAIDCENESDL